MMKQRCGSEWPAFNCNVINQSVNPSNPSSIRNRH